MNHLQTDIRHMMDTDILIVEEDEVSFNQLYETRKQEIQEYHLLYQCYKSTYHVVYSKNADEFSYILCGEITADVSITECLYVLKFHEELVVKNKQGMIIGLINARRLAEQLLSAYQRLHAFSSTILHTIDGSCTVIDHNQNVLYWTKGAEKIFSVNKDEIIGRQITDFFSSDRLELLNSLNTGASLHHKPHQARNDLTVLINSNPVFMDNAIIGAVVSETDITNQVRLHDQLENTSNRLYSLEQEIDKILPRDNPFQNIRGNSDALKQTIKRTQKAAATNANILIHGESGVGKELFAKAVHELREGKSAPYVAINCGAIPPALFESEIFGYEKGAFSGANQKGKKGKVELAKGGTLFLDEIGEMPLEMQVKLLRLLQEKRFYPVGGTQEINVDFRVVAATNHDLKELVDKELFREDLYYRLNVVSLEITPLRSRPEDIIELTHYLLHETSIKYNRPIHGISQTVMQAMLNYNWPGNIRELKNVVERLVVFSENGEMKLEDLPFATENNNSIANEPSRQNLNANNRSLSEQLHNYERQIIVKELEKEGGNKQQCAKKLQITRATLYNRMKKLGITI